MLLCLLCPGGSGGLSLLLCLMLVNCSLDCAVNDNEGQVEMGPLWPLQGLTSTVFRYLKIFFQQIVPQGMFWKNNLFQDAMGQKMETIGGFHPQHSCLGGEQEAGPVKATGMRMEDGELRLLLPKTPMSDVNGEHCSPSKVAAKTLKQEAANPGKTFFKPPAMVAFNLVAD